MGNQLSSTSQGTSFILIFKEWLEQKVAEDELTKEEKRLFSDMLAGISWDYEEKTCIKFNSYDFTYNDSSLRYEIEKVDWHVWAKHEFWGEREEKKVKVKKIEELILEEWFPKYKEMIEEEYLKVEHKKTKGKLELVKKKLSEWTKLVDKK